MNKEILIQTKEKLLLEASHYWLLLEMDYWPFWGIIGGGTFAYCLMQRKGLLSLVSALMFFISLVMQPLLYVLLPHISEYLIGERTRLPNAHIYAYGAGFLIAAFVMFKIIQFFISKTDDSVAAATKRTNQERDTRTDIRKIDHYLPKAKQEFNPEKYFKKAKVFGGLDSNNQPAYIQQDIWRSSHVDIVGTTGSGKGVMAGMLLTQAVQQGEAVLIVDPKDDEYAMHVMGQAARKAGVPFYFIDLLGPTPQWNPFNSKTEFEIEELFSAGFGQAEKGTDADFYRLQDRACSRIFAREYVAKPAKASDVYLKLINEHEAAIKEAPKFRQDLEEVVSMPVLNINQGIDLKKALEQGAVIYVRGSMRNPRALKLQKMFVLSVMQHCEKRDRDTARHVCIFLDEFKYLISQPALEALGAIRDKKAHVVLAHQSLGDLRDCPKDIDPESVLSSINENCLLKIAYKVNDPDTAEWLAKMSGKIIVDDERRTFISGTAMTEKRAPERMLTQTERCLIDTNMLQSLPKRCAALYGNGLAQFIFTSPIQVTKRDEYCKPSMFQNAELQTEPGSSHSNLASSMAEELIDVD